MTVEADLYTRLTTHAGLSALLGTRVYPVHVDQAAARPFMRYQRISRVGVRSINGPSGLVDARFQFDVWADDFDGARAVAVQLRAALDGYTGGGIDDAICETELDLYDADTDPQLYRVTTDYIITHQEY